MPARRSPPENLLGRLTASHHLQPILIANSRFFSTLTFPKFSRTRQGVRNFGAKGTKSDEIPDFASVPSGNGYASPANTACELPNFPPLEGVGEKPNEIHEYQGKAVAP